MGFESKRIQKARTTTGQVKKKNTILVVDDDEDIAMFLKKGLEHRGFNADAYTDPKVALFQFRPGVYDLVLLDIRMPGMNGFELYAEIAKIDKKARVCFLIAFEAYRDGFRENFPFLDETKCYIKKPVTIKDLIVRLKSMLEPSSG